MASGKRNGSKRKTTPKRFIAPISSQEIPSQTPKADNENPSTTTAPTDLPQKSIAHTSSQTTTPQTPQNNTGDTYFIPVPTNNIPQVSSAPSGSQNPPPQTLNNNNENPSPPPIPTASYVLPPASEILAFVQNEENLQKLKDLQCTSIDIFQKLLLGDRLDLWKLDQVTGKSVLDVFEYKKQFEPLDPVYDDIVTWVKEDRMSELPDLSHIPVFDGEVAAVPPLPIITEFSNQTVLVSMDMYDLVTLFMDLKEWSDCFYDQVSNVELLETILEGINGPSDPDGSLKLISAEFHLPSPLVETRKCYFLRSAYEMLDCEGWVVVDFSMDSILPNSSGKYIKNPSGCLIEAYEIDGYSKVTWIDHVEVDNSMVHKLFKPLVTSGYGFGAARWVATLTRQVARASSYYENPEVIHGCGKALMRLAERMTKSFIMGVSASSENTWNPIPVPGSEDILVRTNYNTDDVGSPRGLIVTVATTIWLQAHPSRVFDFLRDAGNRHKWDLLSLNHPTQEIMRVETDIHQGGSISIIPVLPTSVPIVFNLQEVSVGTTCTYIVYTPVDMYVLHSVLRGRDPGDVPILSSGFAIMPDKEPSYGDTTGGTLLTFSFQIAAGENATTSDILPQNWVATFHKIVTKTASLIKAAIEE